MMNVNQRELVAALRATLSEIQQQIDTVTESLEADIARSGRPPISVYKLVDASGKPALQDLTVAKANCLAAIAHLQRS